MSWRDLLRALDQEAGREVDAVREEAARDAERVLADARAAAAAVREAALARARAESESVRRRALADLQRERAHALLGARREVLDAVRAAALEHLRRGDVDGLMRMVDAIAIEVGDAPSTWTIDAARVDAVRQHLSAYPGLLERAELRASAERTGGVEVAVGRKVLDATAAARIERVWPDAEPELAKTLFQGGA